MRKIANGLRQQGSATLPVLSDMAPKGVRTWIKDVCRQAGVTPSQLARAAGFPPATVNRFLNNTRGAPNNLSASTIAALQETAVRLLTPNAGATERSSREGQQGWSIRNIEVIGPIAANEWRSSVEWPRGERYVWPVPIDDAYSRYIVVGLEVEDDSVDLLYPAGARLTCVAFAELARAPRSGERVIVHRVNDAGKTEVTVREYTVDAEGRAWLLSRSGRPDMSNISLGEHGTELPEGITIPFRVIGSYVPEK